MSLTDPSQNYSTAFLKISVKIAKPKRAPPKFVWEVILSILTTAIEINMGRRLPDEVVHRIRIRIEANEDVATIAAAVKVAKKTIYKIWLNLDIWGEPYAPPTVVQGRPKALPRNGNI